jgi:hypothetical protein
MMTMMVLKFSVLQLRDNFMQCNSAALQAVQEVI